jgi:flagellar hook-associated protein 2
MATNPTTTFSGLASGIDSAALIKAMVAQRQVPMTRLTAQQTANNSQSKKLTDIKSKLTALQTATKALDSRTETLTNKVSSSDEKVMKVEAQGGASMGSFKVKVTSLARAERTYSDGFSSSNTAGIIGRGTLGITVGGKPAVDISVTAEDTLESLVKKINASGADVTAGVIKEGANYRLQVTGRNSGASNAIAFTETPLVDDSPGDAIKLGLVKAANEKQAATSATVEVDSFVISSETNAVTGAIPGVTLNVAELGTANVVVDRDPDGLKGKVNSFIAAYNDVMKTLNSEFAYNGTLKGNDSLNGDSTMRGLQSALRTVVSQKVTNGSSTFQLLSSVGVNTQRDGTLALDDAKFTKSVASDYEGVASLFGGDDSSGMMSLITSKLDPYTKTDGSIRSKIDSLTTRNRSIETQLTSMQLRLDKYEDQLRVQFTQLEKNISSLNAQGGALTSMFNSNNSNNSK